MSAMLNLGDGGRVRYRERERILVGTSWIYSQCKCTHDNYAGSGLCEVCPIS